MSLIKQLWLAIIIVMLMAFSGSFIASTLSSKRSLEQQLQMKNIDNANSLALSMSHVQKDPVNIALLLAAQFDTGHYQSIILLDPNRKVISERESSDDPVKVPTWFTRLIPIKVAPAVAQVQDGWKQYGTLYVESQAGFAYEALWQSMGLMLLWSLIMALISGYIGSLLLRSIIRPLDDVVNQAKAIAERRFISIKAPKTIEFSALAIAMNELSARIAEMLKEESARLEQLRLQANYDLASGLMNRSYFTHRVEAMIANQEDFTEGVLIIAHFANLAQIDQSIGHTETDVLLQCLGNALQSICSQNNQSITGRLTGADFALFSAEANDDAYMLSSQMKGLLGIAAGANPTSPPLISLIVASKMTRSESLAIVEQRIASFITDIGAHSQELLHVITPADIENQQDSNEIEWRALLNAAIDHKRLKLAEYPVINQHGQLIHQESPVRLQLKPDDAWLSASEFMAWASRLDLMTRIDDLVVETAIATLAQNSHALGLNVSSRAMCNQDFTSHLLALLKLQPGCAERLWLEVPEQGAFEHLNEFRTFCNALKPLGCKIGIEHVGAQVSRLGELHDIGLDYIKIDVSIIREIDANPGNQAFLRGLCLIAHSIGMMTIAEGVHTQAEIDCLPALGIDGMTGSGIRL